MRIASEPILHLPPFVLSLGDVPDEPERGVIAVKPIALLLQQYLCHLERGPLVPFHERVERGDVIDRKRRLRETVRAVA